MFSCHTVCQKSSGSESVLDSLFSCDVLSRVPMESIIETMSNTTICGNKIAGSLIIKAIIHT